MVKKIPKELKAQQEPKTKKEGQKKDKTDWKDRLQSVDMLGYLKLASYKSRKDSDEYKQGCQEALKVYRSSTVPAKAEFVKEFEFTKNNKNLSWVKGCSESLKKKSDTERGALARWTRQ